MAFVRGTTADADGNVACDEETLLGDARHMCMAAHASGGLVVAQVARLAAPGTLPRAAVCVPGALVVAFGTGKLIVYNGRSERTLEIAAHGRWITGLSACPQRQLVATVSEDTVLNVWHFAGSGGAANGSNGGGVLEGPGGQGRSPKVAATLVHSSIASPRLLQGVAFLDLAPAAQALTLAVAAYDSHDLLVYEDR